MNNFRKYLYLKFRKLNEHFNFFTHSIKIFFLLLYLNSIFILSIFNRNIHMYIFIHIKCKCINICTIYISLHKQQKIYIYAFLLTLLMQDLNNKRDVQNIEKNIKNTGLRKQFNSRSIKKAPLYKKCLKNNR